LKNYKIEEATSVFIYDGNFQNILDHKFKKREILANLCLEKNLCNKDRYMSEIDFIPLNLKEYVSDRHGMKFKYF